MKEKYGLYDERTRGWYIDSLSGRAMLFASRQEALEWKWSTFGMDHFEVRMYRANERGSLQLNIPRLA